MTVTVRESLLPVLLGIAVGDNGSEDTEERVPFQKTALKREADYEAPQRSDPSHRSSPGLRAGEDAVNIANPPEKEGKEGRGSHSLSPPLHNAVDPLPSVMKEYLRPTATDTPGKCRFGSSLWPYKLLSTKSPYSNIMATSGASFTQPLGERYALQSVHNEKRLRMTLVLFLTQSLPACEIPRKANTFLPHRSTLYRISRFPWPQVRSNQVTCFLGKIRPLPPPLSSIRRGGNGLQISGRRS